MTEPLEEMAHRGRGELKREGTTVDEDALREQRRRRRWALGAMSWLGNVQTPVDVLVALLTPLHAQAPIEDVLFHR